MNKTDLIKSLTKVLSTRKESVMAVNTVFSNITSALKRGEKVVISNFGTFTSKILPERKRFIPGTKKTVYTAERWKIKFKPSKILLKK